MEDILKVFQNKHEKRRTVFNKTLDFYLDALSKFDFPKITEALDEEIQALKKEIEKTEQ